MFKVDLLYLGLLILTSLKVIKASTSKITVQSLINLSGKVVSSNGAPFVGLPIAYRYHGGLGKLKI